MSGHLSARCQHHYTHAASDELQLANLRCLSRYLNRRIQSECSRKAADDRRATRQDTGNRTQHTRCTGLLGFRNLASRFVSFAFGLLSGVW